MIMEKKQLNFSAPLLSARRYSSPLRLSSSSSSSSGEEPSKNGYSLPEQKTNNSSDSNNLGEVVKPGTVPFQWEQIPGRAKTGDKPSLYNPEFVEENPSSTTALNRLAHGRNFEPAGAGMRIPGVKSGELTDCLRRPQSREIQINTVTSRSRLSGELNLIRPQGRIKGKSNLSGRQEIVRPDMRSDGLGEVLNKKVYQQTHTEEEEDSEDVAFSDALEALESSYSMNCSTSGLSASDNQGGSTTGHLSKTENREFMINRFLPAAKAMTLDSPPLYSSKRLLVAGTTTEQPQPPPSSKAFIPKIVKQPVATATPAPLSIQQNLPIAALYKGEEDFRSQQSEDDYEEESDDDSLIEPVNSFKNGLPVKSFGFFPWICSKNSLWLVNPILAMKVKTKNAFVSAGKAGKTWVANASPARAISKHVPCSTQMHKIGSATKSCELRRTETRQNGYKSRPVFYSGELSTQNRDLQARNGLSPYRNYRRSSVSPHRCDSPQSSFHHGVGYLIVPTTQIDQPISNWSEAKPVSDNPTSMSRRRNAHGPIYQEGPIVVEKTVHVDPGNITRFRLNSGQSETSKARATNKSFVGKNHGDASAADHSSEKRLMVNQNVQVNPHPRGREMVLVTAKMSSSAPAPPPLPKSPSESWLSRSLMSSGSPGNSFAYTNGGSKFPSRNQSPAKTRPTRVLGDSKWENIVKGSHLQHSDHGGYSEELVARVFAPQFGTRK